MPTSLSTLLTDRLSTLSCRDVYHPGETCWRRHCANVTLVVPSIGVFFVPLVFVPVCRRLDRVRWPDVRRALRMYGYMCASSYVASLATQVGFCVAHRLLDRFTVWSIIFVPALIGNAAVFMMPQEAAGYFANTIFAPIVESKIRRDWPLLRSSKALQTALFMAMSAIILDTTRRLPNDVFWFLQPTKTDATVLEGEPSVPSPWLDWLLTLSPLGHARDLGHQHSSGTSCDDFIRQGIRTYWNIGLVLEIVRIGFSSFAQIRAAPTNVAAIVVSKMRYRLIFFLVGYATAYRTLHCSLSRFQPTGKANLLAALLSGSAYMLCPNLTLLSHATAATVKLLWLRLVASDTGQSKVIQRIHRLPLAQLVYMVCIAYAFHMRVFDAHTTAGFIFKATQLTTGYRFAGIAENIARLLSA